jgi:hypothetical protein
VTKYEYTRRKAERLYQAWYAEKPGIRSFIRWVMYRRWKNRLETMPLYEAAKKVKEE